MAVLLLCLLHSARLCLAADSSLAIVGAGVQQSEDAPFASSDYRFLPGDYLYFTFQIAGFSVKAEDRDEIRKISLSYEVTPQDANGIALTPSSSGAIQSELNPEDKNWTPKRRASFLIPSFVYAGAFRIHVFVKDLIAKTETYRDFPFYIGGTQIQPSSSITVENLRLFRTENDREPLEVPAYNPGDTVYVRFAMVGFKVDSQNQYHLSYGLKVLGPDGKPFIDQPKAAELQASSFYPAQYLPGVLNLNTSSSTSRGEYIVILTVRDLIGNTSYETKTAFSVE